MFSVDVADTGQTPVEFIEGEDFIYPDQVLGLIAGHLRKMDVNDNSFLIAGYNTDEDTGHLDDGPRTSTFAMSSEEWRAAVRYGKRTPAEYALDACYFGGRARLDVYDGAHLEEFAPLRYRTIGGASLQSARIATFLLVPRQN